MTIKLSELRVRAGMSQLDLAEKIGTTQGAISKLESRKMSDMRIGSLEKYLSHVLPIHCECGGMMEYAFSFGEIWSVCG
jgi:DNA-binding Xre family transcriptional regulator